MRLRELLRRRVHGNLHPNSVGEVGGLEGSRKSKLAVRSTGYREHVRNGATGRNLHPKLLHVVSSHERKHTGDGGIGHGRHRDGSLVAVSHVEVTRLLEGHLHRQGHHHFVRHHGIVHGLVVRIHTYIIGRKLVRSAEAKSKRPVLRRIQLRLERKGRCKIFPNLHPRQTPEGRLLLH